MLLDGGGFDIGALVEPGPEVLPGVHGALATVAEVPGAAVVDPTPLLEVEVPDPLTVELLFVLVLVEELPIEPLVPGVEVEVLELPMVVPLFEGVHGAVVVLIPLLPVVVPWFCVPRVPPVTLPGLPATPGVPGLTAGVPVELPPGGVVEFVVPVWVPVVVPVCVPMDDGFVVVPGWVVVVVPGDVVLVVPVPMPVLGVAVPVVWAAATPMANANTADANKIFRIACSLSELLRPALGRSRVSKCSKRAFVMRCPWRLWEMA
jgi:hypothetical protein